jgi:hypothetical protein
MNQDNNNTEQTLLNLEKTAFTLHKCHNYKAHLCKIYNEFIVISTLLVSSFITIFLPLIYNFNGSESNSSQVLNALLGFYISFITALSRFYKPAEYFQIYKSASRKYLTMNYSIRQKIIDNSTSIIECIKDLERLREDSPFINDTLYNKFYHEK